jgi:hypothetical protein
MSNESLFFFSIFCLIRVFIFLFLIISTSAKWEVSLSLSAGLDFMSQKTVEFHKQTIRTHLVVRPNA